MNTLKMTANYHISGDLINTDNVNEQQLLGRCAIGVDLGNAGVRGLQDRELS